MSEWERGTGFLLIPVLLAIGALLYYAAPTEPDFSTLGAGLIVVSCVFYAATNAPGVGRVAVALLICLCGALAAKVETFRADTQILGSEISTRLTASVTHIERQSSGRLRLTLDVIATERPQLRYAPARVRVTAREIPDGLKPGDSVKGLVRLIPPSGPVRPHSYDFAFQSYFSSIGAIGFFLGGVQVAETTEPKPILGRATAAIEKLRLAMTERIQTTIGGPEGAIAAALITGIRAGIPEDINEALRVAGLYHVISISGLHMALVGGTLMLGLRIAFAFAPTFSMRHPVKKYAALIALVATAFYLMISGADVAAQRSFIMLAVMLIAILFDRAALTMRNLAVSAIIILLISPHEVAGPSFQMSFAATAALVASYAAWTKWRENAYVSRTRNRSVSRSLLRKIGATLSGLAMTSVIAGFATALFSAWHFQQVAPMGLFANLAAMPIVSIIVMPMAVVASVLMPFGLDTLPLLAMGKGIAAMNFIAIWLAERSLFDATGAIPLPAVLILTGALACLTLLQSRLRWLALPPGVIGLVMLISTDAVPDILISDDARLVAMRMDDGRLAINHTRPRAFTMQNWQRAMRANEVVGPSSASQAAGFLCAENLCVATHASGARIGHAANAEIANAACGSVTLLIVDDATASDLCHGRDTIVITKRDMARRGSAEIFLTGSALDEDDIRFAIAEPYRPWHEHRSFSREARGLVPYQRSANTKRPGNDPAENAQ